jgi:hypothetical protein
MIHHHHSSGREGLTAGLLGAATVALIFLVRDIALGVPLLPPSVLGQVIALGESYPVTDQARIGPALAYTGLHLLSFTLFGLVLAGLVRLAVTQPAFRFALMILFVAFEVFFAGVAFMLHESTRALFPLGLILLANAMAALVMGLYMWRHHPALRRAMRRDPLGMNPPDGHR